ncbi:MAG: hypothetical protein V4734_08740 [Terriglobus sp.]
MLRRAALGLFLLVCAVAMQAQAIYPPINSPVFRALDDNGAPLAGGKLYTYAAGSSTPLATYADATSGTPNTNPVLLDANGQAKIFLGPSVYRFVMQDANGVQKWTVDNITGAPPPSDVTSVFGRTGAVVAVSGDYSCGQVTGAVCALPTLYYQTLQVAGASQTQRSKLNLLSGTNISVTCADNAGNDSTDCTVAYSGGGGITPLTCANVTGGWSCYEITPTGLHHAFGLITSACTGSTLQNATITFPTVSGGGTLFTANPELHVNGGGQPSGTDDAYVVYHKNDNLTGSTVVVRCSTNIGGSGCPSLSSIPIHWDATGY